MPQIQILPAIPTFGSRLAEALGQVGTDIAGAVEQRSARRALDKMFNPPQQQDQGTNQQPNQTGHPPVSPIQAAEVAKLAERAYGKEGGKAAVNAWLENQKLGAKEAATIRAEKRAAATKEEEKIDKVQSDIVSGFDSAQVSEANLNRMEALKDSPDIISPLGAYLTNMLGLPVSLTSSADTEEFQKLAAQRGLNVASAYGFGRILQTEFNNFLQTIPSLLNSREGKTRIINTLRYFDNLAISRYENYRKLLSERKTGERARDLEGKLTEAMKPQYEKFGEVLKYGDEIVEMKDPEGKAGKVRKSQIEEALQNGYTLAGEK